VHFVGLDELCLNMKIAAAKRGGQTTAESLDFVGFYSTVKSTLNDRADFWKLNNLSTGIRSEYVSRGRRSLRK